MNKYVCNWKSLNIDIESDTSYHAQQKAQTEFQKSSRKKVKEGDISVWLVEKDDKTVTHTPDF